MTKRKNNRRVPENLPVLIRWRDSYGPTARWQEIDELQPTELVATSVGWIVAKNKDSLVLVPHLIDGNERVAKQGCGEMTIPRRSIIAIHALTKAGTSSQ